MKSYRIAFFTVDWNYELVEATLHGLKKFVDDHENVSLCIFDCFGKDQGNAQDRSEYAIFDLPDLAQFDGVLIQGNQIVLGSAREALARKVARAGIPAVTIDCEIEGCTLIGIDNQDAQRELVDHVIRAHGARRLVYLTGIMDNGCPEARMRLEGFRQACRDNGVDESDTEVIACTWRTSDGHAVAERWIRENKPLPDAFICANDEMALGVIEKLREFGKRIPEDTIVTGFDNVASTELSSPRISTVNRDSAALNYRAMELLMEKIDGKWPGGDEVFRHDIICSESCGCHGAFRHDYIRDRYFHQTRFLKNFYNLQDQMAVELFEASNLMELMEILQDNHEIFGCDNIYLCINGFYFDNYDKKQWVEDSEAYGKEMVLAACGRDTFETNTPDGCARFPTRQLLPEQLLARERFLMFYPLHYNTYSIGYLVMDSISEAAKLNLHQSIFSFLEIAIENVRKKELLRQLNDVLDDLYVHDGLTGLYNRFGYDRYGRQAFDAFMAKDGGARVLFADVDDLKGINDRFGHEIGDAAICGAARILKDTCDPGDFVMRYGGDEFLIISSCRECGLEEAVRGALRKANGGDLPYRLGMSVGAIDVQAGDARTLEDCVQAADVLMYENKKRKKAGK